MGADIKKQYLCLDKIPVLSRTVMKFDATDSITDIILVIPKQDRAYCQEHILSPYGFKKKIHLVDGGAQRQDSVYNGLKVCQDLAESNKNSFVLIHDGVRPFVSSELIEDCLLMAKKHGGCIPGLAVSDTIKQVGSDNIILKTVSRESLFAVQTPQAFELDLILNAFEYGYHTNFSGTDDSSFVEHYGKKVFITSGSKFNIKLTTSDDLILGEQLLLLNK